MATSTITDILAFWFGKQLDHSQTYNQRRKFWFRKSADTDQQIRERFLVDYEQASQGNFTDWQQTPQGCLALVILLDQFPRNMFRDSARAFATDAYARSVTHKAIAEGFDRLLGPVERMFLYLPLEHSENLADQDRNIALMAEIVAAAPELADAYDYALRHRDIIRRFGRFPHRNTILGRPSTPEEAEFLLQTGSSF
jgi:uncharacterized protein (DUF924 family)